MAWTALVVADRLEVLGQVAAHRGRQHRHAVLAALAGAHRDLVAVEVHVLHPQPEGLQDPQAGAVQEQRVDAATLRWMARSLRKRVISAAPMSAGWRLSWKKM
jgi:hypothetical protein